MQVSALLTNDGERKRFMKLIFREAKASRAKDIARLYLKVILHICFC